MGCATSSIQESRTAAPDKAGTPQDNTKPADRRGSQQRLPPPTSLSYYWLFNQHYFQQGQAECSEELALATHVGRAPVGPSLGGHRGEEVWLGCFFKSCRDGRPRDATPIDVLVVLDTSASMNNGFSSLHSGGPPKSKLVVATDAMVGLLGQLRESDRFGLATFTSTSSVLQPLRFMKYLDRNLIRNSLDGIHPVGDTTMAAARTAAADVVKGAAGHENRTVHRRLLFVTDQQNLTTADMRILVEEQAKSSVFVSFLCLGTEFKSELAEEACRHRGANYFCIAREEDLRRVVLQDFDFNFIPTAFDLELAGQSDAFELLAVYGAPYDVTDDSVEVDASRFSPHELAKQAKDFMQTNSSRRGAGLVKTVATPCAPNPRTIVRVDTTFPAALAKDGSISGHLVLLRLKPRESGRGAGTVRLMLRHTSAQTGEECTSDVEVPLEEPDSSPVMDPALAKAVALQRYVEVCKLFVTSAFERSPRLADMQAAMLQLEALLAEFEAQPEFDTQCPGVLDDLKSFVTAAKKHLAEVKPGMLQRSFATARSVSKGSLKEREDALVAF